MLAGSEITPPTHPYLASHPLPTLTSRLLPAFTCAESRPQLHSSAHHCQRLPSSLLIENASEQFVAPSAPGPEAFPIKANDLLEIDFEHSSHELNRILSPNFVSASTAFRGPMVLLAVTDLYSFQVLLRNGQSSHAFSCSRKDGISHCRCWRRNTGFSHPRGRLFGARHDIVVEGCNIYRRSV